MSLTPSKQPSEDVCPIENIWIFHCYLRKSLVVPYTPSPFKFGWIFKGNSLKVKPLVPGT